MHVKKPYKDDSFLERKVTFDDILLYLIRPFLIQF